MNASGAILVAPGALIDFEDMAKFYVPVVISDTLLRAVSYYYIRVIDVNDLAVSSASATIFNTLGGEQLVITGHDFGATQRKITADKVPLLVPIVTFGRLGNRNQFKGIACTINTINTGITCTMPAGAGAALLLNVTVGIWSNGVSRVNISYMPPHVDSIFNNPHLATKGGTLIKLTGGNFGPQNKCAAVRAAQRAPFRAVCSTHALCAA
jgi:hypothetical protein